MGPIQRQVLRVLAMAEKAGLKEGLSSEVIARVLTSCGCKYSQAQVVGAISGMANYRKRHWIKQLKHWSPTKIRVGHQEFTPFATSWIITENGIERLNMTGRYSVHRRIAA